MTLDHIKQIETDYKVTILYITKYGSKLYGTSTPESDTDYKGIFIPSYTDRILGTDLDYIKLDTNTSDQANTAEDIDIHLDSIHKWFPLLTEGETGAIDILFSMWSPSVVYQNYDFTYWIKTNYLSLITSNPKAFCGYAGSQARKYAIKGARYNELTHFISTVRALVDPDNGLHYDNEKVHRLRDTTLLNQYEYIKWTEAPAPRGQPGNWAYLEVLGKLYPPTWTLDFILEKLEYMESQYGNRAKKAGDDIDWKALSHAVRVAMEIQELLTTSFITFPLPKADYILDVKLGRLEVESVLQYLERTISDVDTLMESTSLASTSDQAFIDSYILSLYRNLND